MWMGDLATITSASHREDIFNTSICGESSWKTMILLWRIVSKFLLLGWGRGLGATPKATL